MYNNGNYGNYTGYQPDYNAYRPQAQYQPQQSGSGLTWVQGEAGAKSYMVAPSSSVLLMDSENNRFYIKSADASGMPMPLRTFDYTERGAQPVQNAPQQAFTDDRYVTREEFQKAIERLSQANTANNSLLSEDKKEEK